MSNALQRIPQPTLDADIETLRALGGLDDYTPRHAEYSLAAAEAVLARLDKITTAVLHAENTLAALRSEALAVRMEVHKTALGVKDEAMVIYGPDSNQIAALGLKKRSERSKPKRQPKAAASA